MIKATCSAIEDKLEQELQYQKGDGALAPLYNASCNHVHGLLVFSHHEYDCTEEFQLVVFSTGGELYWLHNTWKTSYTQAGLRRIIMSHLGFMGWVIDMQEQEEEFDIAVQ